MGWTYIIEHMEEDVNEVLPAWVQLEYNQMLNATAPNSSVYFTHIKPQPQFEDPRAKFLDVGVSELGLDKSRVCLLDPKAEKELSPEDGEMFDYFLFGGILGDDPPRDRTSHLRDMAFPTRHLGSIQMTTDTAVGVTKKVVEDKTPLTSVPYADYPTITFNTKESIEMPFRYIATPDGEPILPPGMHDHLYEDMNQGFEF